MSNNRTGNVLVLVLFLMALLLATIVFIIDINTSLHVAVGVMYVVVILYSWLLPGRWFSVYVAVFCSILIVTDIVLAPPLIDDTRISGLNSIISLVVVWISAGLVTITKRSIEELESAHNELELEVKSRTAELQKSEASMKHMVSEIKDYAIFLLDTEGNIINWNRGGQRIQGYRSEEIIGKNSSVLYSKEERSKGKPRELLDIAIKNGYVKEEGYRLRKNSQPFMANVTITALHDSKGHVIGFSKIIHDLTNQKRQQERAQHARELEVKNKEMAQFAYVASHDLQEPLRTIIGLSNHLQNSYADKFDENGRKSLAYIVEATNRMSNLVKGLLDYSRIGKNKEMSLVDSDMVVQDIRTDLSSAIEQTGASFKVRQLPKISGYKVEFRLLMQNLISNALKFRQPAVSPSISIWAVEEIRHWKFAIKDDGIGIPKEQLKNVFVIFKRLHNRGKYDGTGIGLAHCQKIAEMHGGNIWVESTEGEGSIFFFTVLKV